jgi:hypothetical protein
MKVISTCSPVAPCPAGAWVAAGASVLAGGGASVGFGAWVGVAPAQADRNNAAISKMDRRGRACFFIFLSPFMIYIENILTN